MDRCIPAFHALVRTRGWGASPMALPCEIGKFIGQKKLFFYSFLVHSPARANEAPGRLLRAPGQHSPRRRPDSAHHHRSSPLHEQQHHSTRSAASSRTDQMRAMFACKRECATPVCNACMQEAWEGGWQSVRRRASLTYASLSLSIGRTGRRLIPRVGTLRLVQILKSGILTFTSKCT